jgi:hypothetical protein
MTKKAILNEESHGLYSVDAPEFEEISPGLYSFSSESDPVVDSYSGFEKVKMKEIQPGLYEINE